MFDWTPDLSGLDKAALILRSADAIEADIQKRAAFPLPTVCRRSAKLARRP